MPRMTVVEKKSLMNVLSSRLPLNYSFFFWTQNFFDCVSDQGLKKKEILT